MPLQGTDVNLAFKLKSDIIERLRAKLGHDIIRDDFLQEICQAISEQVIFHIIQNARVFVPAGVKVHVNTTTGDGATIEPGIGEVQ
jgi:hypothetical protein